LREVLFFKSDAKIQLIFESASVCVFFLLLSLVFFSKHLLTLFMFYSIIGMYKFSIFA